ncbi:MAG: PEP-CTERM sorting domain-containing protein [Burkholderiaceae bacterium]
MSDSLLAYTTLGAGGCTIGAFTFTSFTRQGLSEGATAIDGISVTPVSGGGLFGLDFTLNQGAVESFVGIESVSAPPTTVLESRISFQLTGTPTARLNASTITLNGAGTTGDGNVSAIQNLCVGGRFIDPYTPGACSAGGTPDAQNVVFITGIPELTSSTLAFLPTMMLAVMNDIVVDGGTAGSATLDSVSNRFTAAAAAVPEPAPLLLIGAGLISLFLRRRRSR